ncbi:MAG: phosphoribosylanthranilate isomerase [Planctomycetaceae bacterium]
MWIKICGIRDVETALAVAKCGVQAIGLNFYERSPRVVALDVAARIVTQLPTTVDPVGLFVNQSAADVRRIAGRCGLRTVQLHGDEPPEVVAELAELRVIRAFRVGGEGLSAVAEYLETCRELGSLPWACLLDARVEGTYGGTGKTAPWEAIRRDYRAGHWPSLILAGGLTPENVAAAVRCVRPWGVDVAGGVEKAVACKDAARVQQFVAALAPAREKMEDGR